MNINLNAIKLTLEQLILFKDVALYSEYEDEEYIKKWNKIIKMDIIGNPTLTDTKHLFKIIQIINNVNKNIHIIIDNKNPDITIYFIPQIFFSKYSSNQNLSNNFGFTIIKTSNCIIKSGEIYISSTFISQQQRLHIITEELIQSLGLLNDTNLDKESIFYSKRSLKTYLDTNDLLMLDVLYSDNIKPCMNNTDLDTILK
jgi:hypothetical protein